MTSVPAFTTLGGGPTVLMLHGIGGGHLAFAPQVETLATAGYRAVAWDMPGYGHSAPIEPYTFKGLAQSCIELIEQLKCEQVILLGHSMGGMVAQEVVRAAPTWSSGPCSAAPRPPSASPTATGSASSSPSAPRRSTRQDMAELAETLVPQMVGAGSLPEGVRLATHCMGAGAGGDLPARAGVHRHLRPARQPGQHRGADAGARRRARPQRAAP